MRRLALLAALVLGLASPRLFAQKPPLPDVATTLDRVAAYLEAYFARAQSIVADETVRVQELNGDLLSAAAPPRILKNELRISWEPAPGGGISSPQVLREPVSVNGRAPREKDQDKCFDPQAISPEILGSLFLPENRAQFTYRVTGTGRSNKRPAILLEIRDTDKGPVIVETNENCSRFGKPGSSRWRAWIDAETYAVLRLDESLAVAYDVTIPADRRLHTQQLEVTVERVDTSIVYRRVTFKDPDESVMLPASRETVQVIRNSPTPRVRTSYTYRNYRRFMTGGRIVQ
ncbi:MAG: hypothetical protein AB7H96_22235 [Vicinamibacterales bacterium]